MDCIHCSELRNDLRKALGWLRGAELREAKLRAEVEQLKARLAPLPDFNTRMGLDEYGLPLDPTPS